MTNPTLEAIERFKRQLGPGLGQVGVYSDLGLVLTALDQAREALKTMVIIAEREWGFAGAHPMREAALTHAKAALALLEPSK